MSKVEVIETRLRVYRPIRIVLETEEEFSNMYYTLSRGDGRVYDIFKQMTVVAGDEHIIVKGEVSK